MVKNNYIDLFAGCGGLSLGLTKAGWQGIFAIEKTPDAFNTLKHNLIDKNKSSFDWPKWLPCKPMTTSELIKNHSNELKALRNKVDLIAGGPPCQGFSFAGRRNPNDPRNKLTEEYIQIVKLVQPRFLLLENVKGFKAAFKNKNSDQEKVYAEVVKEKLEDLGYTVSSKILSASIFGVPQPRQRFIMIAMKNPNNNCPFEILQEFLPAYRKSKGIHPTRNVSVKEAISDLECIGAALVPSLESKGFSQIDYKLKKLTKYQSLMRQHFKGAPNSLRLARHNHKTLNRFKEILNKFEKGKSMKKHDLEMLGTKKQCLTPLHPDMLSRTITTLPDDLIHYSEPRILTVRENARIQSFPDWFDFTGKYTTGGARRKDECPRYTQVGNAVPPLMAEAIGLIIKKIA